MALYQTKETPPRFGTMLIKNLGGWIVLEMKGKDGNVEAFVPDAIEEVMPYTVEITRFQGGTDSSDKRIYECKFGDVKVGDVLVQLSNGSMYEVTALDTKSRSPTKSKNGFFRLSGDRLILGS